ncbi:unnamed protein product [marine sediment metagenome]|uniref:Uncharacterized protein n=1 Tax=marine sediment metagenome TaxID=412755 RepID=X1U9U0_9ZZZZ
MRTKDPETGYIGRNWLGEDFGPDVRCRRCSGRGMWKPGNGFDGSNCILCLRCADEWFQSPIIDKHRSPKGLLSNKRWLAAFEEFCQTKPKEIDMVKHNAQIKGEDTVIQEMFPQYF